MRREFGIPFVVWVGSAFLVHLMWTAGAERVARVVEDVSELRWFAESVRSSFATPQQIEVQLEDLPPELRALDPEDPEVVDMLEELRKQQAEQQSKLIDQQKTEPEVLKPEDPVQLIPIPSALAEQPKSVPVDQANKDQRLAVEQHVEKDQEDNPNARFIGDEANHVEEETVARITSHDQNDPNPTPGGQHSSADKTPGNADETVIGDSEDQPGDPDHAPGEHVDVEKPGDAPPERSKPKEQPAVAKQVPAQRPLPTPQPTTKPAEPKGHDLLDSQQGTYSLDPSRKTKPPPKAKPPVIRPRLGLNAGPNDNGVRTSLDMGDVVATVGSDELSRQRAADGERRRSKHRGSWHSSDFERWRGSIENYVSFVRPGNQTALNTARVPFATYLVRIHNRIHPVFADTFLASLDALPFDNPINDYKLMTRLEIVVEPEGGRVIKMGVIKTSGITAFDVGALDSVQRSGPFGKAPSAIISTDGNVYLHWEFHRNPIYACSTMNARPYMINRPRDVPKSPPKDPKPPSDPREQGVPPSGPPEGENDRSRYGRLTPLGPTAHA